MPNVMQKNPGIQMQTFVPLLVHSRASRILVGMKLLSERQASDIKMRLKHKGLQKHWNTVLHLMLQTLKSQQHSTKSWRKNIKSQQAQAGNQRKQKEIQEMNG
jgi:hypothetical protein